MAVLQMQRISICALKKDRKKVLELLQHKGVIEIERLEEESGFQKMDTSGQRVAFEKNASLAESALEILQTYVPQKKGLLSSLEGKRQISHRLLEEVAGKADDFIEAAYRVNALSRKIAENRASIVKHQNRWESLQPWKNLDVPMNFKGTESTAAFIGTVPEEQTEEQILTALAEADPELDVHLDVVSSDKNLTYICLLCLKKDSTACEEALRSIGFARSMAVSQVEPAKRQEMLLGEIEEMKAEIEKLEQEITVYAQNREELEIVADFYHVRAAKYEVLGGLLQSKKTFVVTGYIPENKAGMLKMELESKFDLCCEIEPLSEEEEPPVLLKNNGFSANYEGILGSFGLPHKGEIDPTTIMSFFYFVFFGLMLSDAGYGAVIFFGLLFILRRYPNMDPGMKKALKMFMWCGLSTMIWGLLFGGFFGDIVDVVAVNYFGVTIPEGQQLFPVLWFVPLKDPMRMLMYSMLFGVIHLFTGLALKGYTCLKDKRYGDFMWEVVIWFVFLIGLILLLLPSSIFEGIAGMDFPDSFTAPGKVLAIIGLVGILFMGERKNKNWLLRILLGAYDIYGVTSWLSDVLSYSRLLALGLATGVIASVINQMGSMVGTSVIGTILFIIIFIGGQTFSLAINLLGAYVHTNRLQYVEFFGKFYEGGGRPFNPFKITTKYINVEEDA
ncbi:MAG: V-type ATP synthase subunit I [Eubacteriales bacterium]|nr:V-type ATP synthase subunit I [Eubacteriales bacterium]